MLDRNRVLLKHAQKHCYKLAGDEELNAYVFTPASVSAEITQKPDAAAIVFFSSSHWDAYLISQFAPHCLYLASRGMVTVLAEYRVSSRGNARPTDAMDDARDALAWLRLNAANLGIHPDKIVAAGASGGGHLAISTALFPAPEEKPVATTPNAVLLFNPILDTTRKEIEAQKFPNAKAAKAASPIHHLRRKLPPTLILHGTADRAVPFEISKKFARKMRWRSNKCVLSNFDGQGHGFFNFNVDARLYEICLNEVDRFLVELGFLDPTPEITETVRLAAI
jgi:acetyl esterase/lipase